MLKLHVPYVRLFKRGCFDSLKTLRIQHNLPQNSARRIDEFVAKHPEDPRSIRIFFWGKIPSTLGHISNIYIYTYIYIHIYIYIYIYIHNIWILRGLYT